MVSLTERIWTAAHATPWFPSWWVFQIAAIGAGALALKRPRRGPLASDDRLRAVRARDAYASFVGGVLLAPVLAVVVGSGAGLVASLRRGALVVPELEVAGFGALAGFTLGAILVARWRGLETSDVLDTLAPSVPAILAVARLGCFFAGCDFGAPTTLPWGLRYPHLTPAFRAELAAGLVLPTSDATLPVHPSQLYESALGLALLVAARRRPMTYGAVIVLYAIGRAGIDLVRGDLLHGMWGLTSSQLLAIAAIGTVSVCRRRRERRARPGSTSPAPRPRRRATRSAALARTPSLSTNVST